MATAHKFEATIYKTGINWCVDVPEKITSKLTARKGYIRIHGLINKFKFTTNLVPVKNSPHRLFVNHLMMKGGKTALGETASFEIRQAAPETKKDYPVPKALRDDLKEKNLVREFDQLTDGRRKDILRYLNNIKTEETLRKNIRLLTDQLINKEKNVRIPLGKG